MEEEVQTSEDWKPYEAEMMQLCIAKTEEFHLLGYAEVEPSEVWTCVQSITKGGNVPLHQLVETIICLKIGKFMNVATMNAYKGLF